MLLKNTIQLNDGTQFFIQLSIDTIKLQLVDGDNHDNFFKELKDFNITIWKDKTIRYNNLHSIGRITTDNIIEIYGISQYIKSNKMHQKQSKYVPFHQKELLASLKPLINKLKKEHFTNVIKVCDTSTNFKSVKCKGKMY